MTLTLTINGETKQMAVGSSVAALMAEMGLESKRVAIERNGEIVPRSQHGTVILVNGDVIEIVEFIGGG